MFTDDTCKEWDVRVVGDGKCVEYCKVDGRALREGLDCHFCRKDNCNGQSRLI